MPDRTRWITVWRADDGGAVIKQDKLTKQVVFSVTGKYTVLCDVDGDSLLHSDDYQVQAIPYGSVISMLGQLSDQLPEEVKE